MASLGESSSSPGFGGRSGDEEKKLKRLFDELFGDFKENGSIEFKDEKDLEDEEENHCGCYVEDMLCDYMDELSNRVTTFFGTTLNYSETAEILKLFGYKLTSVELTGKSESVDGDSAIIAIKEGDDVPEKMCEFEAREKSPESVLKKEYNKLHYKLIKKLIDFLGND